MRVVTMLSGGIKTFRLGHSRADASRLVKCRMCNRQDCRDVRSVGHLANPTGRLRAESSCDTVYLSLFSPNEPLTTRLCFSKSCALVLGAFWASHVHQRAALQAYR